MFLQTLLKLLTATVLCPDLMGSLLAFFIVSSQFSLHCIISVLVCMIVRFRQSMPPQNMSQ